MAKITLRAQIFTSSSRIAWIHKILMMVTMIKMIMLISRVKTMIVLVVMMITWLAFTFAINRVAKGT